jgi:hypothetical protein
LAAEFGLATESAAEPGLQVPDWLGPHCPQVDWPTPADSDLRNPDVAFRLLPWHPLEDLLLVLAVLLQPLLAWVRHFQRRGLPD